MLSSTFLARITEILLRRPIPKPTVGLISMNGFTMTHIYFPTNVETADFTKTFAMLDFVHCEGIAADSI